MTFKNTSRYPTGEVRQLVEFAAGGIDTAGLAINIKNAHDTAFRGRAYRSLPPESPLRRYKRPPRYLITVGIGGRFPYTETQHYLKRATLRRFETWQECLVYVATHELMHIQQFRYRISVSELECEEFAAHRLRQYRGRYQGVAA